MQDQQLLAQIKEFTQTIGYVSVSSIQRRFILDYESARQLVNELIQQRFCEIEFTANLGHRIYKQ